MGDLEADLKAFKAKCDRLEKREPLGTSLIQNQQRMEPITLDFMEVTSSKDMDEDGPISYSSSKEFNTREMSEQKKSFITARSGLKTHAHSFQTKPKPEKKIVEYYQRKYDQKYNEPQHENRVSKLHSELKKSLSNSFVGIQPIRQKQQKKKKSVSSTYTSLQKHTRSKSDQMMQKVLNNHSSHDFGQGPVSVQFSLYDATVKEKSSVRDSKDKSFDSESWKQRKRISIHQKKKSISSIPSVQSLKRSRLSRGKHRRTVSSTMSSSVSSSQILKPTWK